MKVLVLFLALLAAACVDPMDPKNAPPQAVATPTPSRVQHIGGFVSDNWKNSPEADGSIGVWCDTVNGNLIYTAQRGWDGGRSIAVVVGGCKP